MKCRIHIHIHIHRCLYLSPQTEALRFTIVCVIKCLYMYVCMYAPALFTVAMDWMTVRPSINIGSSSFSDLVYADDFFSSRTPPWHQPSLSTLHASIFGRSEQGKQIQRPGYVPIKILTRYWSVFTARCYASAVLAMALCPSVCPSVRPSQVSVLLKRLNVGSQKQHHTIAQEL